MEGAPVDHHRTCRRAGRRRDKERLRILDACLLELENAHERDEVVISPVLALRLRAHVPSLAPRMRIADAIDIVFQEQLQHLLCDESEAWHERTSSPDACVGITGPGPSGILRLFGGGGQQTWAGHANGWRPLDETAAQALTEEIRKASRLVSVLLLEAHERYAWSAMGYRTWEQYVRREFGLSRTRSYELLDQGRIVLAIKVVSGSSEMPDISAYAALQIKPHLEEVLELVRFRTAAVLPHQVPKTIADTIREFRAKLPQRSGGRGRAARTSAMGPPQAFSPALPTTAQDVDLSCLASAIEYLGTLPPAPEVAASLTAPQLARLRGLRAAIRWLADMATACDERREEMYPSSRAAP
jgi:hypothetical protein